MGVGCHEEVGLKKSRSFYPEGIVVCKLSYLKLDSWTQYPVSVRGSLSSIFILCAGEPLRSEGLI